MTGNATLTHTLQRRDAHQTTVFAGALMLVSFVFWSGFFLEWYGYSGWDELFTAHIDPLLGVVASVLLLRVRHFLDPVPTVPSCATDWHSRLLTAAVFAAMCFALISLYDNLWWLWDGLFNLFGLEGWVRLSFLEPVYDQWVFVVHLQLISAAAAGFLGFCSRRVAVLFLAAFALGVFLSYAIIDLRSSTLDQTLALDQTLVYGLWLPLQPLLGTVDEESLTGGLLAMLLLFGYVLPLAAAVAGYRRFIAAEQEQSARLVSQGHSPPTSTARHKLDAGPVEHPNLIRVIDPNNYDYFVGRRPPRVERVARDHAEPSVPADDPDAPGAGAEASEAPEPSRETDWREVGKLLVGIVLILGIVLLVLYWIYLAVGMLHYQMTRVWSSEQEPIIPEMVSIPAGCFDMGSPADEPGRGKDERRHRVCVDGFELGKYEVTFEEYDRFVRATGYWRGLPGDEGRGWFWERGKRPVNDVEWEDAGAYAAWLSRETGQDYRLPTEAEWEYAARAGTASPYWTGECIDTKAANFNGVLRTYNDCATADESKEQLFRERTLPVGSLAASPWGLYDVAGNVLEWTCSAYDKDYRGAETVCVAWAEDIVPWTCSEYEKVYGGAEAVCAEGSNFVQFALRGGDWESPRRDLRSAYRISERDAYRSGFRLVRAPHPRR